MQKEKEPRVADSQYGAPLATAGENQPVPTSPRRDVRALNRGIALLRSMVAEHEDDRRTGEHEWRQCRRCLALGMLEQSRPIADLAKVLEDYERLLRIARANHGKVG
jgi:hypothetical protein